MFRVFPFFRGDSTRSISLGIFTNRDAPRLDKIEAMLSDDPADVFLRYSQALELSKLERDVESLDLLKELIRDSQHVPS